MVQFKVTWSECLVKMDLVKMEPALGHKVKIGSLDVPLLLKNGLVVQHVNYNVQIQTLNIISLALFFAHITDFLMGMYFK